MGDQTMAEVEGEVEVEVKAAEEDNAPLDVNSALKQVLRTSLYHDGLARGLHEAVKALDRTDAQLCVISDSIDVPAYKKLVTALCKEHKIASIAVPNSKTLGEWAGLCKYNSEGEPVKVVGCACVVIKQWGEDTRARQFL